LAVAVDQDVVGLEVAVHHQVAVGELHGVAAPAQVHRAHAAAAELADDFEWTDGRRQRSGQFFSGMLHLGAQAVVASGVGVEHGAKARRHGGISGFDVLQQRGAARLVKFERGMKGLVEAAEPGAGCSSTSTATRTRASSWRRCCRYSSRICG
jgi:hypothetical protein